MLKKIIYIFLLIGFMASCSKNDSSNDISAIGDILYSNSFESSSDTSDFSGYCSVILLNDTPEGGGENALAVSCGCIAPHASMDIGSFDEDVMVVVSFYGKGMDMGGTVSLSLKSDNSKMIYQQVIEEEWMKYQTAEELFCPAGEELTLSFSAGGIAAGSIFVDLLEIVKVPE